MPRTEHFHVIQPARARTSSRDTFQWYRIPPLNGPRASLYCTRYPVNTRIEPSSIRTGKFTVSSRFGCLRTSSNPGSSLRRLPTRSICRWATSNGLRVSFGFSAIRTRLLWQAPDFKGEEVGRSKERGGLKGLEVFLRHELTRRGS